jgi:RimJ/RimL family protein N-acetyltransferase
VIELATDFPELTLCELTLADAREYYELIDGNRAHLSRLGDFEAERTATLEWVRRYFEQPPDRNVRFGIRRHGALVGRVDLNPVDPPHYALGCWVSGDAEGHGYASAACRAAAEYARDALGAVDVSARIAHGNARSEAMVARVGFVRVARFERYDRFQLVFARARRG